MGSLLRVSENATCQCEQFRFPLKFCDSRLETGSTQFTHAKIDSALSPANCASCRAAKIICTAYRPVRITFAGMLNCSFPL